LLAKNPKTPLGIWMYASSFTTFASVRRLCRSELAREKPEDAAGHLDVRVIVHDLRAGATTL
jgi:hypothetical protein